MVEQLWRKAGADGSAGGKGGSLSSKRFYPCLRFQSPDPNDSHIVQTSAFQSSQPLRPISYLTSPAGCLKGL